MGIEIEVERHANFEPFTDATLRVLRNIVCQQFKLSIQNLSIEELKKKIIEQATL
jgi:hypothetical protein